MLDMTNMLYELLFDNLLLIMILFHGVTLYALFVLKEKTWFIIGSVLIPYAIMMMTITGSESLVHKTVVQPQFTITYFVYMIGFIVALFTRKKPSLFQETI